MISLSNPPVAAAVAARSWDRAEYASSASRSSFQRAAISSAPIPWLARPWG